MVVVKGVCMKTALYLGKKDSGMKLCAGYFRNEPPKLCKFVLLDWDGELGLLVVVSFSVWKFAIELLWVR